jgi:hypothetical protein
LYIHASNSGLFTDLAVLPLHFTRLAAKLKIDEKYRHMKKPDYDRLYQLALKQEGFFTANQAANCGYSRQLQVYYVRKGEWLRNVRSIFRFKYFPVLSCHREDYIVTQLWTEDKNGEMAGVFAFATALYLHNIIQTVPAHLDVIVPRNFRRNSLPPFRCRFFRRHLDSNRIEIIHGLQVTNLLWTFVDLFDVELIERRILIDLFRAAFENGKLNNAQMQAAKLSLVQRDRLMKALREIGFVGSQSIVMDD